MTPDPREAVDLIVHLGRGDDGYDAWTESGRRRVRARLTVDSSVDLAALRGAASAIARDIVPARVLPARAHLASRVGAELFEALFAGAMREAYATNRELADRERKRWRLVLVGHAAALGRVPWELRRSSRADSPVRPRTYFRWLGAHRDSP